MKIPFFAAFLTLNLLSFFLPREGEAASFERMSCGKKCFEHSLQRMHANRCSYGDDHDRSVRSDSLGTKKNFEPSSVVLQNQSILLISDIDDTIKQSALRHPLGKLRALRSKPFALFEKLYTHLLCGDDLDRARRSACLENRAFIHPPDRWVAYVTGAPGRIALLGNRFLEKNRFPQGSYWSRDHIMTPILPYKIRTLSTLLSNLPKSKEWIILLVGDNGEEDSLAFQNVTEAFKGDFEVHSFIHQVYDQKTARPIPSEQRSFMTVLDLAVRFFKLGLISWETLVSLSFDIASYFEKDDKEKIEELLPSWVDCRDFFRTYQMPLDGSIPDGVVENLEKIESLCLSRPS